MNYSNILPEKNLEVKLNKRKIEPDKLERLSKEELIDQVKSLHAQNVQLKQVLSKTLDTKTPKKKITKPFDFSKCIFRHVLLKFYYLGWDSQGYATQDDTNNTIEFHLFEALTKTCLIQQRSTANYHRCGRTDKGVSAFGQVISIDLRSRLPAEQQELVDEEIEYCKLLNKVLPENIQCVAWCPVQNDFSARFNCKSRTYKYFFPKGTLNIEKMQIAANYFVGSHDFRNFCKMDVGNGVVQFKRTIFSLEITPLTLEDQNTTEYNMFVATIKAQSFLWHQIRCIMGVLFLVGEGRENPEVIQELLNIELNPRKPDYNMASEVPLNLYICEYDLEDNWIYDSEALSLALNKLLVLWSFHSVKTTMIKSMVDDLQQITKTQIIPSFTDSLLHGVKSKNYVPLLQRKKCESLESRIDHFVKRKKLVLTDIKEERPQDIIE